MFKGVEHSWRSKNWCSDENTEGFNFSKTGYFQDLKRDARIQDSRVEAAVSDKVHDVAMGIAVNEVLTQRTLEMNRSRNIEGDGYGYIFWVIRIDVLESGVKRDMGTLMPKL